MARDFDRASSEYLERNYALLTGYPCAMACWFNVADGNNQILMWIGDKDSTLKQTSMSARMGQSGDPLRAFTYDGSSATQAETSTSITADTWMHGVAIWESTSSRQVLLNNGGEVEDTTSTNNHMGDNDRVCIGRAGDIGSPGGYADGAIAEAGFWDLSVWPGASASDKVDEFKRLAVPALADGCSPLFFRLGLVGYYPLGGLLSNDNSGNDTNADRNLIGPSGSDLDPNATPGVAAHPSKIIYPSLGITWPLTTAAAPAATNVRSLLTQGVGA